MRRPPGASSSRTPSRGALGLDRQRARDRIGITHPQGHPSQGATLARAIGVEERELAELRIHADEREAVGLFDHVHAKVVAHEAGQRFPLADPEGDVVEAVGLRSHLLVSTPHPHRQSNLAPRR